MEVRGCQEGKIKSGLVKDGEGGVMTGWVAERTCMLNSGCSTGSYRKCPDGDNERRVVAGPDSDGSVASARHGKVTVPEWTMAVNEWNDTQ